MGFRTRSATPGTVLCLAATILLAVVSFNTPLLKSLYFLEANFSEGQYAGRLRLGTLGYCLSVNGQETCVGPTVGYNFNPNALLNITGVNIPEAITRYLTYTLILHIVALAFAVAATIFGLLSHISTLSLLCFPTCTAAITSTCALLALIFDLVIFYIAKSRIDSVSGASATIGISVWLTLAAWLCAGFSGCAYGIGRCCVGKRNNRESGDPYAPKGNMPGGYQGYNTGDDMRLHAIRDEQLRKQTQKEQGLPSFHELERQPLTSTPGDEDKFLEPDDRVMPGGLRRDGSVLNGVGVGYGRRTPRQDEAQNAYGGYGYGNPAAMGGSVVSSAGAAGVGAGGGGIDRPDYNQYQDPYAPANQNEPAYNQNRYGQPEQIAPGPHSYSEANYREDPYASQDAYQQQSQDPYAQNQAYGTPSSDSHYPAQVPPSARVDPYDAYGGYDQGLSSIGMAAAGTSANQQHYDQNAYRHQRGFSDGTAAPTPVNPNTNNAPWQQQQSIHQPRPQHLATPSRDILQSPVSEVSSVQYQQQPQQQGYGSYNHLAPASAAAHGYQDHSGGQDGYQGGAPVDRPPSYGTVPAHQVQPEKSQYRP